MESLAPAVVLPFVEDVPDLRKQILDQIKMVLQDIKSKRVGDGRIVKQERMSYKRRLAHERRIMARRPDDPDLWLEALLL